MDFPRPCGCKATRTCLICEESNGICAKTFPLQTDSAYVYCPFCNKAWPGWNVNDYKNHPQHDGVPIDYPGVYIHQNFLTPEEESFLITSVDKMPWDLSQSGRRKQNFGPKCNFKKRKLKAGSFSGFPSFSKFVQENFCDVPLLQDFQTIEQCSLEYDPKRGASIDPHIDDCWIWGERVVTVNLLSDSVLTMTFNTKPDHYNLHLVGGYPAVLDQQGKRSTTEECYKVQRRDAEKKYPVVRIPMPRRSLLVLYNSARYDWEHQILRRDIVERRVCLAYREFTPPFLQSGEKFSEGEKILLLARQFQNVDI